MNERIKVYLPELNCPYCHDDIGVGNLSISCACGAVHHSECVDDMGGGNTCGSCTYVFNSPEAVLLGVEHFKKPESLDEIVSDAVIMPNKTLETNVGTHVKAFSYLAKDGGIAAVKGVGRLMYYTAMMPFFVLKGWCKTHFSCFEKKEEESVEEYDKRMLFSIISACAIDGIIAYSVVYSVFELSSVSFLVGLMGAGIGAVGGSFQTADYTSSGTLVNRGLNRRIADYSKSLYAEYVEKAKGEENE